MGHTSIRFGVSRPGPYLVKVTWSPYWQVARAPSGPTLSGRDGRAGQQWRADTLEPAGDLLSEDSHGFIIFHAPAEGVYELRFDVAGTAEAELAQ
jgi:hypothetical protein